MLKSVGKYFGLLNQNAFTPQCVNFIYHDNIEEKITYLKELSSEENERQNIIEGKTSQLIGQTSVIFSLLGLFITMYFDKIYHISLKLQVILIILFILTLLFYLITLLQSTKYLNISKFSYVRRTPATVNDHYLNKQAFLVEEAKDLIKSIENNTQINNCKADYLVYAYRSFKVANILVGIFSLMLLLSVFNMPKESTPEVIVSNRIEIKDLKESLDQINKQLQNINSNDDSNVRLLQQLLQKPLKLKKTPH